jgi:rare lipoprotein A
MIDRNTTNAPQLSARIRNNVRKGLFGFVAALVLAVTFAIAPTDSAPVSVGGFFGTSQVEESATPVRLASHVDTTNTASDSIVADSIAAIIPIEPRPVAAEVIAEGQASFYGAGFAGRPTANGERFDPTEMTAAHRTLPFGTRVRVTNVRNGQDVIVRINDRGPFHGNRIIDLSRAAASEIGMVSSGVARVRIERLTRG